MRKRFRTRVHEQRGVSIIELLVGVAVGIIVVTGAVKLMSDTLSSNRRLTLETRVNQDLRAAADLIARDIRRAGYWNNAVSGVFNATGAAATPNPHRDIQVGTGDIRYNFARQSGAQPNDVDAAEWAGFQLKNDGTLELLLSRNGGTEDWRPMNDPGVVRFTTLTITPLATPRVVELYTYCTCLAKLTCTAADFQDLSSSGGAKGSYFDNRPTLTIRQFTVLLAAEAANDPSIRREIAESVRVRNDRLDGSCPTV
jgi:type IV pilus assembly protein PilW